MKSKITTHMKLLLLAGIAVPRGNYGPFVEVISMLQQNEQQEVKLEYAKID